LRDLPRRVRDQAEDGQRPNGFARAAFADDCNDPSTVDYVGDPVDRPDDAGPVRNSVCRFLTSKSGGKAPVSFLPFAGSVF